MITPVTPIPTIQAAGDLFTLEECARILETIPSYASDQTPLNAPVPPPKVKVEPKIETAVTVKHEIEEEAPVPRPFSERKQFYSELSKVSKAQASELRGLDHFRHIAGAAFTVCCNNCTANIPDAHWHCSICEDGDYDLCRICVTAGVHCGVEGHFLIKRCIENGRVVSSITETVPKKPMKVEAEKEVPGAFTADTKDEQLSEMLESSLTCNCCVNG